MVLKLKLEDRIQFLGRVVQEDVQQLLLKADCTIINSNFETFSMVALESILTGCPVICTSCGGPEQFINKSKGKTTKSKKLFRNSAKSNHQL